MPLFSSSSMQSGLIPKDVVQVHICPFLTLREHKRLSYVCKESLDIYEQRVSSVASQNLKCINNCRSQQDAPSVPNRETIGEEFTFVANSDGKIQSLFPEYPSIPESIMIMKNLLLKVQRISFDSEEAATAEFSAGFFKCKKSKLEKTFNPELEDIIEKMI